MRTVKVDCPDALLESGVAFVIADGHQGADHLSESQVQRIKESGRGYSELGWYDQIAAMSHPSIGWFLTHAGWNGICEALVRGVPMIAWPLVHCDQQMNAALIPLRKKPLGFELLQIRQGAARQAPYRGGGPISGKPEDIKGEMLDVLKEAFHGEKGRQIRENVEEVRRLLIEERETRGRKVWQEWGSS